MGGKQESRSTEEHLHVRRRASVRKSRSCTQIVTSGTVATVDCLRWMQGGERVGGHVVALASRHRRFGNLRASHEGRYAGLLLSLTHRPLAGIRSPSKRL